MIDKKGIAHPALVIVIGVIAIWALVLYLLISQGIIKKPKIFAPAETAVELKTKYNNPFDKQAQYVNPFDQYKSPFQNLK